MALHRRRYVRTVQVRQHGMPAIPNRLNQQVAVLAEIHVWVSWFAWARTLDPWLTMAVLLDLYLRRVLEWAMSPRQIMSVVVEAWHHQRPIPELIHHSDQGNQYRASLYQTILARRGVVVSMSRRRIVVAITPVERFFSSLKNELVRHRQFHNHAEAQGAIEDYIDQFYNRQRLHQALGYRSPEEVERQESDA